ncbi:hypothetical protein V6N12_045218 [Hibiscus sabdariffa]|uniref:Secreted protein n=1 Tax=Hibiscus sabdariffa TaxID=183260 RepID=A0ABR2G244_9ROSI
MCAVKATTFWVFVFKFVSPLGQWLLGTCLDFEAITVIMFDINMNSLCFVACWYGGQKICASHYRRRVRLCLAFSMEACKRIAAEMWMPLVDT